MAIENLDKALKFLAEEVTYIHTIDLRKRCFNDGDIDIDAIVKKLQMDKYIIANFTPGGYQIKITFDGESFIENGGYQGELNSRNAEKIRIENLERIQIRSQKAMTWLTSIIAVGTTIAAIYYGIEIYKYFNVK